MHVVTVNDYLARRDSEWVGQVHRFLGLEVGLVQQGLNVSGRLDCLRTYAPGCVRSESLVLEVWLGLVDHTPYPTLIRSCLLP